VSLYLSGGGPQAGGGPCTDPTISSTLGNVADQSGAYAPTLTHDGASVLTTATNTSTGAVTVTDSATTTPSVPEPAAGSATLVTHTTTASDGLTHSISFVVAKAAASDGPSTILSTADFGDYDFTTTGGTGGSGGAGPHTLPDGTTCTVHAVGSGATVAKIENGVFVGNGDTSNYYNIEFDLGADTEWINVWALAQWTLGETAASGSLWMKQSRVAADDANKQDDLQFLTTSSTDTRHRFLNSATTFNNVLDTTGLSLGSADQLEMRWRATNMYATCETRQGTGTLPEWKGAAMTSVKGDVRATTNSFRRYLYVRVGGQDATLNLLLQKGS